MSDPHIVGASQLLPDAEVLTPFLAERRNLQLLWFLRADPAREPAALLAPIMDRAVRIEWSGRIESLLIGRDPVHWTHAVLATATADAIAAVQGARGDVEAAALWVVEAQAIPRPVRWAFRALRPIGRLLERDPLEAVRFRPAAMDDSEINPSQERLEKLAADPRRGRTTMINLLGYRQQADYRDGGARAAKQRSGRAAYRRYGLVAARSVGMLGGSMAHLGRLRGPLLDVEGLSTTGPWHDLAIVHYPAPASIVKLEAMPGYARAVHHRSAGLERTVILVAR